MKEKTLEKLSVVELLEQTEKANRKEDDDAWEGCWDELMNRGPFDYFKEEIEEVNSYVEKLEDRIKKLEKIIKTHLHVDNRVVVNFE